jgi:Ca2+-binding EF-hand superfamily protein
MTPRYLTFAILAAALALPAFAQEAPDAPEAADDLPPFFAEADLDGDGQITSEEVAQSRAARAAAMDADADGFLTADELNAYYQAESAKRIAAMVAEQMARQDMNGDGKLGAAEVMIGGGEHMSRLFDWADADKDGAVSAEEFDAARDAMRGERFAAAEGRGDRSGPRMGGDDHGHGWGDRSGSRMGDGDHRRGGHDGWRGHRFFPRPEGNGN